MLFRSKKKKLSITQGVAGNKVRRVKLQGELVGKQLFNLERYVDGKNSKLVPTTYKLQEMHKSPYLHVYGPMECNDKMDKLYKMFGKQKVKFVVFSERELKNMEKLDFHNWITFDKFMKGDNKPFRRVVSAYLIEKLITKNPSVFDCRMEAFKKISTDLFNKLDTLDAYHKKNSADAPDKIGRAHV